jgi:hypothetical protein
VERSVAVLQLGEKAPVEPEQSFARVKIVEGAIETGCRNGS